MTASWPHEHQLLADQFAKVALHNIACDYPNKLDHVLNGSMDLRSPRELHPVFYGSYDWHSAVHMHWMLARILRLNADSGAVSEISNDIGDAFDRHFSAPNITGEIAYLQQPSRGTFERTYGWAWLLKLQTELDALAKASPRAGIWPAALQQLTDAFVMRYLQFLPKAHYPIRAGTHANSAFGLLFALEYAEAVRHRALRAAVVERAQYWFGNDYCYPAQYEPGGDDFLSGGLVEAALMSRVLNDRDFAAWWERFCPAAGHLTVWWEAVSVSDRTDPKMSHLDGLNLSRAWCWRMLENALPTALSERIRHAITVQLATSLPHAASGNYVGTHWLASFATLALTTP